MPPHTNQSVIALDYGERRVGVAVASTIARIASPLTTLDNNADLVANIKQLVESENAGTLVVGYPRAMDGQTTSQTEAVVKFIEKLKGLGVPIETQDESLTSVRAEAELNARKKDYIKADIDSLAATYILEDYLER